MSIKGILHENPEAPILVCMGAEIGLGCWAFGNDYYPGQDHKDSVRTIHTALRNGITHFDTAQGYGRGRSEQITGQQIRRFRNTIPRESVTISTKIMVQKNTDVRQFRKSLDTSLRRLCTDYVDTCYIHWPVSNYDFRPLLDQMETCRKEGMLNNIGLSNFPPDASASLADSHPISWYQGAYSLLWRKPEEEILPMCREKGIRFTAYSPLAQGLLGNHTDIPNDRRKNLIFCRPGIWEQLVPLIEEFRQSAGRFHLSPAQTAVRWLSEQPGIDIVLLGARTSDQLTELLQGLSSPFPAESAQYLEDFSRACTDLIPAGEDNIFSHHW